MFSNLHEELVSALLPFFDVNVLYRLVTKGGSKHFGSRDSDALASRFRPMMTCINFESRPFLLRHQQQTATVFCHSPAPSCCGQWPDRRIRQCGDTEISPDYRAIAQSSPEARKAQVRFNSDGFVIRRAATSNGIFVRIYIWVSKHLLLFVLVDSLDLVPICVFQPVSTISLELYSSDDFLSTQPSCQIHRFTRILLLWKGTRAFRLSPSMSRPHPVQPRSRRLIFWRQSL